MTDVTDAVTESVLPCGGTVPGGEPGQRRCRRPGCGNLVPVSGRGRTRVFCGDACSRRFHNAARSPGGDGGAVSPGQAADPLGALEALIRQAGSVVTLARGQVAALDAEVVAAQLAEAEAARRRAEARAVTAGARAAEAEEDMLAALEAAQAAHRGREAAEAEARRAGEETARARRELAEEVARARAGAEAAAGRAGPGWPPRPPGSPRPPGRNAIRLVSGPRRRFVLLRLSWPGSGRVNPAPGSRPAARPGTRHEHREGCPRAGAGKAASPCRPVRPASTSPPPPPLRRFDTGTGNLPPGGQHARKFTSSQVTVMIQKEGTYVRAMTIAPARQLTLDIPGPGRGEGRDREQVRTSCPVRPGPGCCACSRP